MNSIYENTSKQLTSIGPSEQTDLSYLNERDMELDNLKTIIIALNQKVKSRDDLEKELQECKKNIKISDNARDELREQIEENTVSLND